MTNIFDEIVQDAENVEAAVVGAITKLNAGFAADVNGVLTWLQANMSSIQSVFATLLNEVIPAAVVVGSAIDPAAAPVISGAAATVTPLLDAAEAAIDALSKQAIDGTSVGTTASSTYAAYKAAEAAVNQVLTATSSTSASSPATTPPASN